MKKVRRTRYIAECGRGFWEKKRCLTHEQNCKCWSNPKHRTCKTCVFARRCAAEPDVGILNGWFECENKENPNDEHVSGLDCVDYISVSCEFWRGE